LPRIAFLSQGRLFLVGKDDALYEITSEFAREFEERKARQKQVHGWKEHSGIWGGMGFAPPQFSQWEAVDNQRSIRFLGVDRGPSSDRLSYLVGLGPVTGLFAYEVPTERESRLFHKNDFPATDLAQHRRHGTLVMSVAGGDGTKHLVIAEADGRFPKPVTLGDTIDECPRWIDDDGKRLVYQSSGLLRDQQGHARGLSPYAIERLDLAQSAIEEVLASEDHDLLQPHARPDGSLYFIRRPYARWRPRTSIWTDLQDIVLFPFRLARAIFHFLNFFSMMFSGKPLTTAGGPERPPVANTPFYMLWGQMIDTRRRMFGRQSKTETGLVPKEWELVHRTPDGRETIVQSGVLTFDVDAVGNLAYTDGRRIHLKTPDGAVREVADSSFVERLVLLDDSTRVDDATAAAT